MPRKAIIRIVPRKKALPKEAAPVIAEPPEHASPRLEGDCAAAIQAPVHVIVELVGD